jgi:mono/diheme cytochrome c family protein
MSFRSACFAVALFSAAAASASGTLREQRDASAKEAFRTLNFFSLGHGMHLSPGIVSLFNFVTAGGEMSPGPVTDEVTQRWGLVLNDKQNIAGFFDLNYKDHHVGVVGCAVCHSGRAAGRYIVGLGNKTIDVVTLATDVHRVETYWKGLLPEFLKSNDYRALEKSAMDFSSYLANPEIGNLTQGLVPVSFIRGWFYRAQNQPLPAQMLRGQIKVPFLWGYEFKRKAGQFCDGFGNGEKAGWAIAVELASGQTVDAVRAYFPKVEAAEKLFNDFLPPKYPFKIDKSLAAAGQAKFEQTCARCHGNYTNDQDGLPVYEEPKFIPLIAVRTDSDRLNGNTPEFMAQVENSPLNDVIQHLSYGPGYFAPRLNGVWSRFPYLHNGSVPNIRALLMPPEQRPKLFSLKNAGERERFDENALGLTVGDSNEAPLNKTSRQVYDTSRTGHSNQGHEFYLDLTEIERTSVIEYLKTL